MQNDLPRHGGAAAAPETADANLDQFDVAAADAAAPHPGHGAADNLPRQAAREIDDKAWGLRFRIGASRRYTSRRAAFYGRLDNGATVVSLIAASAAFGDLLGQQFGLALYASVLVAAASACSLAFRWSDKARLQTDLYRRYTRLHERLVRGGALAEIEADYVMTEADEPATMNVLMAICHNEEVTATGADPAAKRRLRWWQGLAANVCSLPPRVWDRDG